MVKTNYITGIKGGTSTWSLDKKLQGRRIYIYELTDQGRIDKGAIATQITK